MRLTHKYKIYTKIKQFYEIFPKVRILKFKHTKWLKLHKKLKKFEAKKSLTKKRSFYKKKHRYKNFDLVQMPIRKLVKLQHYYRESLELKRAVFAYYDQTVTNQYFKNLFLKLRWSDNLKKSCLIEPFFKVEVLLWKLGLFSSTFEINQYLASKKILVNNQSIQAGYKIKKGDVISFFNLKLLKPDFRLIYLFSFIEVDYYQNKLIVLKDFKDVNENDTSLLAKRNIDMSKFKYYINRK